MHNVSGGFPSLMEDSLWLCTLTLSMAAWDAGSGCTEPPQWAEGDWGSERQPLLKCLFIFCRDAATVSRSSPAHAEQHSLCQLWAREPVVLWVPILHSPGCQHSCCSFPHCSVAKVMLLGRLVWCRQWLGSAWEFAHDGNGHCESWLMHGSGVATNKAATNLPSPLPQMSWACCSRARLAPLSL